MAAGSAKLQTPGSEAGGGAADDSKAPSWNNKKAKDEFESFKAKLLDQRFDPKHFQDPLLPRNGSDPRNKPKGTPEVEGRIDQIIAQYKARN
ncbi:hypothetical protein CH063_00831 [Colletotrichum higginsianum]|uniref:Uncharacterized protein n=2 Tax=Colletotrichum higginsianum TaxID=80884 RepID=H1UX88_COLHI|nr:hypothetical protein CH63R_00602 [Colletotrichum higginsianum IMI 349063]OBR15422.1 hypothetical protein CH63R_00602 [Colletotrichum higginsianum IMI 349063]TID04768.1 hypothetical protein CH35J_002779 [Colletotrichum higginsianum]CCF32589.1 hypothetical protein CH063_00831 [Colletotrichum higginsianum]